MSSIIKSRLSAAVLLLAIATTAASAGVAWGAVARNPYWFSWGTSDCGIPGTDVDPVSTYFTGSGAKGGRVRSSLILHMGRLDSRWFFFPSENMEQWFKHYDGACLKSSISIANGSSSEERMHIRGAQVASPGNHPTFETGLTPHYELEACGGHQIAYAGAPNKDGGHVRNGGYVYARIKVQQAYGNGRRRGWPFSWHKRNDSRRRRQCTWTVADGGTLVHIQDGNGTG